MFPPGEWCGEMSNSIACCLGVQPESCNRNCASLRCSEAIKAKSTRPVNARGGVVGSNARRLYRLSLGDDRCAMAMPWWAQGSDFSRSCAGAGSGGRVLDRGVDGGDAKAESARKLARAVGQR